MTKQTTKTRLTRLEINAAPVELPCYQLVWPDGETGAIMPVAGAPWAGLLMLRIRFDDPGDLTAPGANAGGDPA